jgi:hypothetical protein
LSPNLHQLAAFCKLSVIPPIHQQVLPVLEGNQQGSDDIVDEKDVKTEVMRSRGAGGQVFTAHLHL